MKLIKFLRSPDYALYAVGIWLLSFLLIIGSQVHNNFSYLILMIPTLISLRVTEIRRFFTNPLSQGILFVILSLVLAAAVNDGDPLRQAKFGLIVILFFLAVARLPTITPALAYRAAWSYLCLLIVYIIFNMAWMYINGSWLPGMRLGQHIAKLENVIYITNTMGGMLAIITLLALQSKKVSEVIFAHILVLVFSLAILQTRSILGIWILILLLSYLTFQRSSDFKQSHLIWSVIALILIAAGVSLLFSFTSIGESLISRKFYRFEAWDGFIRKTVECGIWLGCGPDNEYRHIAKDGLILVTPHSAYITQFFRAGLIGLIPLIALTAWVCIKGFKTKSWAAWYFMAGALGLLFDGSSLVHSPSQRWLVFHLPLALLIAQQLNEATIQPPKNS
jgi:hypothetical protein